MSRDAKHELVVNETGCHMLPNMDLVERNWMTHSSKYGLRLTELMTHSSKYGLRLIELMTHSSKFGLKLTELMTHSSKYGLRWELSQKKFRRVTDISRESLLIS